MPPSEPPALARVASEDTSGHARLQPQPPPLPPPPQSQQDHGQDHLAQEQDQEQNHDPDRVQEQELADRSLPLGGDEPEASEASLDDLRHALAGVDRDGVLLVLGRLKAQYDELEQEHGDCLSDLEGLRADLASVHDKYETSMDRVASLRAELREQEAQLSDALEAQADADTRLGEMGNALQDAQRAASLAARRAEESDAALADAQAALDHERQLTLEAEKATAKHKAVSSAQTDRLRKELAAARREAEKAARSSAAAVAMENVVVAATGLSSPASSTHAALPDDSTELRAELEAAHVSHARIEASLQSSDVQIRALREDNLELKEQCEALQRQLEDHHAAPDVAFFGAHADRALDTSRLSHEVGGVSLADETQMGLDDRLAALEAENVRLAHMVAQLQETNGDLTTCMEKMVDQINNQEGYAQVNDKAPIKVLAASKSSSRTAGAGAQTSAAASTPAARALPSKRPAGHASKSSIDWGSFIPRALLGGSSAPSTPRKTTASTLGSGRRIARNEEVEDEFDRAEREKVRATMEQYNNTSPTRPAHAHAHGRNGPKPAGAAGSAQGLGSFFAQLLPASTSTPSGIVEQTTRTTTATSSRSSDRSGTDRFTPPPTRLAYRPRVRPAPAPTAKQHTQQTDPSRRKMDT